jgi:hypothetical protein
MYIHGAKLSFMYLLCQYEIVFLRCIPVIVRQDRLAVLNPQVAIVGYVQGGWVLGRLKAILAMYLRAA